MPMPVEMRHDKITDLMLRTGEEDVKRVCEFVTRDCGQRRSSSSSKISNNQPGVGWLEVCMRTTNVFGILVGGVEILLFLFYLSKRCNDRLWKTKKNEKILTKTRKQQV